MNYADIKKGEFLKASTSKKAKLLSKIIWAVCLLAVVITGISANKSINGSVFEIPLIGVLIGQDEVAGLKADYQEAAKELEIIKQEYEKAKDNYDRDKQKIAQRMLTLQQDLAENCSINNIRTVFDEWDEDVAGSFDMNMSVSEDFSEILGIVIVVLLAFAAIIALLTLLTAFFKQTVLGVFAAVLACGFSFAFGGMELFIIALLAYISVILMCSIINKEYKAFKKGERRQ